MTRASVIQQLSVICNTCSELNLFVFGLVKSFVKV